MRRADWLVDVGPDAGEKGGQVLFSGPPEGLREAKASHTARYLFNNQPLPLGKSRKPKGWLPLASISCNNLRQLDVEFPLGVLTTVTGVSGSGKSSLVTRALTELVSAHLGHEAPQDDDGEVALGSVAQDQVTGHIASGAESLRRLVHVDQKPIGRMPRSNLATYTGLFDHVRKLFAGTPAAKSRRFDAGRFLFQRSQGAVRHLRGRGLRQRTVAVHAKRLCALPDLPWLALQREDARHPLAGKERRRRPRVNASSSPRNCSARNVAVGFTRSTSPRPDCIRPMSTSSWRSLAAWSMRAIR
jgi:excinuclease UvrABC ATPase subunit